MRMPEQVYGCAAKAEDGCAVFANVNDRPVAVQVQALGAVRMRACKVIIPPMLREIRSVNPNAQITLLIATGCHRGTTKQELIDKFGEEIVANERICVHDCDDRANLVNIGVLPSGGVCEINEIAYNADLLLAEGFIEPHFFAGFSGGRKSVLPGVSGRTTVLSNHCSEFMDHPKARTGMLAGNPVHEDMLWAAQKAKLCFVVNVVLNEEKDVIYAVAGDVKEAHEAGVRFLSELCGVKGTEADIAITSNGGYPLDQNVYQAVKGMTAAEAAVKKGGVIIMLAQSGDGIGGAHFYRQLSEETDIQKMLTNFRNRKRNETEPDQWQSHIFGRVLLHASVIYVSDLDDDTVRKLHMIPAKSVEAAMELAKKMVNTETPHVAAIPEGVSVIVQKET